MQPFVLLLAPLLILSGCATLPDTRNDLATLPLEPARLTNTQGLMSAKASATVLDKLDTKGNADLIDQHLPREQAINPGSPLVLGNKLTLLQNGPETYRTMFAAIRSARDHINLETYIFDDDEIGQQFADLLLERQAAGVQVNVIYDSIGALGTATSFFERMRAGGINVLEFNPVNPLEDIDNALKLNNRDHRRQLIIDGRIAFTGGVNISATYSSAPSGKRGKKHEQEDDEDNKEDGWRDTHLRIEGPIVAQFQQLFLQTWARQKGQPLAARQYFPPPVARGDQIVRVVGSKSGDEESQIYLTLISAIESAQQSVHLTIAYFAPDEQLRNALTDAARRGVDVKLVLPSYTDSSPIFHLGRSYYSELLESGVAIYERKGAIMHAKTASIDGIWSTVGSTNLDWRSFLHNDEMNAIIVSREFAAQMDVMFKHDVSESHEIVLEEWQRRSPLLRIKEQSARIAAYWM